MRYLCVAVVIELVLCLQQMCKVCAHFGLTITWRCIIRQHIYNEQSLILLIASMAHELNYFMLNLQHCTQRDQRLASCVAPCAARVAPPRPRVARLQAPVAHRPSLVARFSLRRAARALHLARRALFVARGASSMVNGACRVQS